MLPLKNKKKFVSMSNGPTWLISDNFCNDSFEVKIGISDIDILLLMKSFGYSEAVYMKNLNPCDEFNVG